MRNIFKRFQINKTRTHFAYRLFSYFTIMSVFYSEQKQKTKNEKQRKFRMDSNWSQVPVPHPQPSSTLSLHPTEIPASVPTLGHGQHCSVLRLLSLNMLKLVRAFHCHWSSSRLIKCQAEDEACECPGPDFQRDWAWSWSASDHTATLDKVSRGVERCEGWLMPPPSLLDLIHFYHDQHKWIKLWLCIIVM